MTFRNNLVLQFRMYKYTWIELIDINKLMAAFKQYLNKTRIASLQAAIKEPQVFETACRLYSAL